MKKFINEIDILRGMAILMVILYHSIIVFPINLHEFIGCSILHDFLWLNEMPLFFMVSGFCFSFKSPYQSYLLKKVKRILVPHFVFGLLDYVPRMIPNSFVNKQVTPKEAITEFLLYGGNNWFLWSLFVIFAIFPLVYIILEKGRIYRVIVFLFVMLLYVFADRLPMIFLISTIAKFLPYFLIGYLVRRLDYEAVKRTIGNGYVAFCSLIALSTSFALIQLYEFRLNMIVALSGAVVWYYIALQVKGVFEKLLLMCSKYSLQMYLLDGYALVLTRTVLVNILKISSPSMIISLNFVLDVAIVLVIAKYFLSRFNIFRWASGIVE